MIDAARLCLLITFLLAGLVYTIQVFYHSRRVMHEYPQWTGRIWTLGILSWVGYIAFMLLMWFPHYIPQLNQWTTPLFAIMAVGILAGIVYQILIRRILF